MAIPAKTLLIGCLRTVVGSRHYDRNTGLIVSEVALGTMQFGGKMNMGNLGQEDTTLERCR
jgi:aryl-alcohol dehydrogenase-like predicted oxidoreductase